MYRNIVFDLGGVVINYSPRDYLADRFFSERVEKRVYDIIFGSEEWLLLDRGALSWIEACAIFKKRAKEKDLSFEVQAVIDDWTEMLTTRKATVVLMRLLKKKGFNLYYMSNIAPLAFDEVSQREFFKLFVGGVTSYEAKSNKPDLVIYKTLLEKYNILPEETIFTDDDRVNATAAFDVGITGIQFKSVKSFVKLMVDYGIDL